MFKETHSNDIFEQNDISRENNSIKICALEHLKTEWEWNRHNLSIFVMIWEYTYHICYSRIKLSRCFFFSLTHSATDSIQKLIENWRRIRPRLHQVGQLLQITGFDLVISLSHWLLSNQIGFPFLPAKLWCIFLAWIFISLCSQSLYQILFTSNTFIYNSISCYLITINGEKQIVGYSKDIKTKQK